MKVECCDLCGKHIISNRNPQKNYSKVSYGETLNLYDSWTYYDFCPNCSKRIYKLIHNYLKENKIEDYISVKERNNYER